MRWATLYGIGFPVPLNLGIRLLKPASVHNSDLNTDLTYRTKHYEGQFAYDTLFSTSDGEQEANREVLSIGASRYLRKRWQLLSKAKFEHNLELQLDKRFSILGAAAFDVRKTHRSSFLLVGGVSYSRESYFDQELNSNAEGLIGATFQIYKLYTPKVDITANYYFLPNLTTSGRIRMEFDTSMRFEIFRDFYVSFSFYDSYDNRPPSDTATTNDYGFVTGVTWTFHR